MRRSQCASHNYSQGQGHAKCLLAERTPPFPSQFLIPAVLSDENRVSAEHQPHTIATFPGEPASKVSYASFA